MYCPHPEQSILGVLLRAIYNYIIVIIELLLRGGGTQGLGSTQSSLGPPKRSKYLQPYKP